MTIRSIEEYWHDNDRVVLVTDDSHAAIQIEFPKEEPEIGFIYRLWVDPECRHQGYATTLLDAAESIIAAHGCSVAALEHDKRDTSMVIYRWYERRGYHQTEFSRYVSRMEKQLKQPTGL